MKLILVRLLVICVAAAVCGMATGLFFTISFYGFLPRHIGVEIYLSDTLADVQMRFWIAFAVGAVGGVAWSIKVIRDIEF